MRKPLVHRRRISLEKIIETFPSLWVNVRMVEQRPSHDKSGKGTPPSKYYTTWRMLGLAGAFE